MILKFLELQKISLTVHMGCIRNIVLIGYRFCRDFGCPETLSNINNALNGKLLTSQ